MLAPGVIDLVWLWIDQRFEHDKDLAKLINHGVVQLSFSMIMSLMIPSVQSSSFQDVASEQGALSRLREYSWLYSTFNLVRPPPKENSFDFLSWLNTFPGETTKNLVFTVGFMTNVMVCIPCGNAFFENFTQWRLSSK